MGRYVHRCISALLKLSRGDGSKKSKPPLHPIPVQRAFQIVGVDVLELPKTKQGIQYAIVFQDVLNK